MNRMLITLAAAAALVAPSAAFAMNAESYEAITQFAHRWASGQADDAVRALGTNKQTGEFSDIWYKPHHDGAVRYCQFYARAFGGIEAAKCAR